ncbi:MAG: dephospho-CoA kinase [Alphaproteobacteria bacterium]|nr:dephospho-CoA kinase [Alphaproteobacteria bacterium]
MRILGLTGSIGMGKSTTARLFAECGVPVYDADAAVHSLYEGAAVSAIEAAFPGTTVDGRVDRRRLSECVIGDPAAMGQLEAIVHPMLRASREKFLGEARASGAAVAVLDIPLLFETGAESSVDAVVVVSTSQELQRQRVLERGIMDEAGFEAIRARQMDDVEKRARADFVIDTSHGLEPVRQRIRGILADLARCGASRDSQNLT